MDVDVDPGGVANLNRLWVGLGMDATLHGTCESRSCLFPLGRPVYRKACKTFWYVC